MHVKKLILDVLKPHQPDVVEFACHLAAKQTRLKVGVRVVEMDEKTDSIEVVIEGGNIDMNSILEAISEMGASLHSIDGVEVLNSGDESE